MIDLLPWLLVLLVVALAVGYALGRRTAPAASGAGGPDATGRPPAPAAGKAAGPLAGPMAAPMAGAPQAGTATAGARRPAANGGSAATVFGAARSWGYQLQRLDPRRAAASPFDVLVVDTTRDGSDDTAWTAAEIARLQQKPDGSRRIVLAYLSIGEAEDYRGYWQPAWKREKPAWLLGENPEWEGNYAVCFWDPGWQALVCGSPEAPLDRILAQGFDGIYLDKCDVTDDLRRHFKAVARTRPNLEGDMVTFVHRLADYARRRAPDFLVVMQNAEDLLVRPEMRAILDGVAKEELLYGLDGGEKPNAREDIAAARKHLDLMRRDGKPVLVVEYLGHAAKIETARAETRRMGYVLYVAPKNRELDRLAAPV